MDRPLSPFYGSVTSCISIRSDLLTAFAPVAHQDRAQSSSLVGFGPPTTWPASYLLPFLIEKAGHNPPTSHQNYHNTITKPAPLPASPSFATLLSHILRRSFSPSTFSTISTFHLLYQPHRSLLGHWDLAFCFCIFTVDYIGPMF